MKTNIKPSGIEWIGDIPSDWEVEKLKYVTKLRNETGKFSTDAVYIGLENIESSTGKFIQTETEYNEEAFYNIFKKGDVLFGKLRPYLEKVFMPEIDGFCSGEFLDFKEFEGDKRYLFYFLLSHGFIAIVNASTYGAKMPRAEWDYIRNLNVSLPVLPEQKTIATFLDTQCTKVDNIITELEQQIEILKQYKTSLITETVTKGLDKTIPMKDSGIDWIGKIPVHWEVKKLKYFIELKSGDGLTNDLLSDDDTLYPVFGGGKQMGYYEKSNVSSKNILIGRVGANCGCITKIGGEAWATDNALIATSQVNTSYLYYLLLSADLNTMRDTNAQPLITASNVINIKMPFSADIQIQKTIASFLDSKCKEISGIIEEKQQSIDTMKAYKKSLIYEYVTGKKRVKT